jgi:hypothetical protein
MKSADIYYAGEKAELITRMIVEPDLKGSGFESHAYIMDREDGVQVGVRIRPDNERGRKRLEQFGFKIGEELVTDIDGLKGFWNYAEQVESPASRVILKPQSISENLFPKRSGRS